MAAGAPVYRPPSWLEAVSKDRSFFDPRSVQSNLPLQNVGYQLIPTTEHLRSTGLPSLRRHLAGRANLPVDHRALTRPA